ncbi:hypothetical protein [Massilimicrobiota sp. An134]|uniref:hypothetical protein n=1 Tax=Massilimicrobiota sp. An134 TaxID=1965557 RepID=UPI000B3AB35C|nr:hypothetical protein [Massilimicrobiota sp. An134]OUQ25943.1 hypothetical protein B5E79_11650 [Massilimicrobiota sp. An134]
MWKKIINVFGFIIALMGIIMWLFKIDIFSDFYINYDLVPGAMFWLGILLLLVTNGQNITNEYNKIRLRNKESYAHTIEYKNKRNEYVELKSKSIAFDLVINVLIITYLILTVLGEFSFFSFVTIGIVLILCMVFYVFIRYRISRSLNE